MPEKRTELENGPADRRRGERTGGREAGKERDHHDRENVFDDQDAEDELGKAFLLQPSFIEDLDDDGGGGNGKDRAEKNAVHRAPAEALAERIAGRTS